MQINLPDDPDQPLSISCIHSASQAAGVPITSGPTYRTYLSAREVKSSCRAIPEPLKQIYRRALADSLNPSPILPSPPDRISSR
jgi:hypothetical protein